jgi:hypothetical protein
MTHKFKVVYHNGDTAIVGSETTNVADFCNEHFGSVWEEAKAMGAVVELVESDENVAVGQGTVEVLDGQGTVEVLDGPEFPAQ